MLKACVGVLAFFVGVFPIAWKIYETGYEFREASDPSRYDDMKEYFSESTLPFVEEIDSAKHSIRVYFFVVPFVVCCGVAVVKLLLQKRGRGKSSPWTRKLRPLLNHPLKLPHCLARLGLPYAVTVLDIVVVMTFLILNLALVWSRTHRSLGRGPKKLEFLKEKPGKDPIPFWSWGCVEIVAKTLGVVSIVNLGWYLMVPIGRRSVFLELMHISWESAIKYHRWLGYYTCIVTIVHSLLYFVIWAEFNGHTTFDPNATMLRTNLVWGACDGKDVCSDDQKIMLERNIYGILTLVCMGTMTIFSLDMFRRHHFEIFWYLHHLYVPLLIFLCFHYSSAVLYLAPGIVLHLLDKLLGLAANFGAVRARATRISSSILELRVRQKPRSFLRTGCNAGQYVFLNVPGLSTLQWHPMSVTWASEDEFVLHVKALGDWTRGLYENAPIKEELLVKIDGFYGKDAWASLYQKNALVLWAGGVGLTYCYSIALAACREGRPVFFCWVVRSESELMAFKNLLIHLQHTSPHSFHCKVWWTQTGSSDQTAPETVARGATAPPTPSECAYSAVQQYSEDPKTATGRIYQSQLWPRAFHAFVASGAILLAIQGYAHARATVSSKEAAGEPDGYLHARFMELFWVCVLPTAFILAGVLVRAVAIPVLRRRMAKAKERDTRREGVGQRSVEGVPSAAEGVHSAEGASAEQGKGELLIIEGSRPDIAVEFQEIESALLARGAKGPQDIGVLACGPLGVVHRVQDECKARLLDVHAWDFDLEEWEW